MKKFLRLLFIVFIFSNLFIYWFSRKEIFLRTYHQQFFAQLYSQSQYVKGEGARQGLGDDGLYAFAGYYYTFQGGDVSAVNFEHPPLGKYLIGLSIFLFKNERAVNIIYFLLILLSVYKLSRFFIKDKILQLLPVFMVSVDPLFLDHTSYSLLDLPFTLFFVWGVYYFVAYRKKQVNLFISQLFWAAAFSTRFFPMLVILEILMFFLIFLFDKSTLRKLILSLFVIPFIYLVTHFSFFVYHPSIVEFLRHKKWMLAWFSGTQTSIGNILRVTLLGFYLDSTGHIKRNDYWSIFPALTVLLSFLFIPFHAVRKFKIADFEHLSLFSFSFVYFLYVFFLTPGLFKFLMPIYPVMTVLAVSHTLKLYSIIRSWKQARPIS